MPNVAVETLHDFHPKIRAADFRSPLVIRLLKAKTYQDGSATFEDSCRHDENDAPATNEIELIWQNLKADFDQCANTYQDPNLTELATLGLMCLLVQQRLGLQVTEVTRRGERADYWLGNRQFLMEVSGQQHGNLETLRNQKAEQLLANPFKKSGYVCVANYDSRQAFFWFYRCPQEQNQ